jgi:hypothetical protein
MERRIHNFVGCRLTYQGKHWDCSEYRTQSENFQCAWEEMKKEFPDTPDDANQFFNEGGKIEYFISY